MKPYELVLVLKASLTVDEKKDLLDSIIDIIGKDSIKQTDDIGVLKTAYPLDGKKENTHMHLISYYLSVDPLSVNVFTKKFAFLKGLVRHYFYAMKPNEKFMTYSEVQKSLETLLPVKEEKVKK
jgi:ribosomal protein S6